MIESKRSDDGIGVSYDCDQCIDDDKMGKINGRLCLKYQIDLDEDVLTFSAKAKDESLVGEVTDVDELFSAMSSVMALYKTGRVEVALKSFRVANGISGICPKSLYRLPIVEQLLHMVFMCIGGYSGTELIHLPFPGTILDQPNMFIDAYNIVNSEYSKWNKEQDEARKHKDEAKRQ